MQSSLLRQYSIGVAAENKLLSSNELEFYAVEVVSYINGELTATKNTDEHRGTDAAGNDYVVNITMSNTQLATWLPNGSNRQTPPDIRRGERVQIWQYADCDKFYWSDLGLDHTVRKLETVRYVFSGTRDESVTELDPTNCYYFEVSTHLGQITLHTSKANSEPFGYTVQLDTMNGKFAVTDDVGNHIHIDSNERLVQLKNKDGSFIEINKKEGTISLPDKLTINTKDLLINAKSSFKLQTSTLNMNFDNAKLTGGALLIDAVTTFAKGIIAQMTLAVTGALTQNGVNVGATHIHGGVSSGLSDSGPVKP